MTTTPSTAATPDGFNLLYMPVVIMGAIALLAWLVVRIARILRGRPPRYVPPAPRISAWELAMQAERPRKSAVASPVDQQYLHPDHLSTDEAHALRASVTRWQELYIAEYGAQILAMRLALLQRTGTVPTLVAPADRHAYNVPPWPGKLFGMECLTAQETALLENLP